MKRIPDHPLFIQAVVVRIVTALSLIFGDDLVFTVGT